MSDYKIMSMSKEETRHRDTEMHRRRQTSTHIHALELPTNGRNDRTLALASFIFCDQTVHQLLNTRRPRHSARRAPSSLPIAASNSDYNCRALNSCLEIIITEQPFVAGGSVRGVDQSLRCGGQRGQDDESWRKTRIQDCS